MTVREAPVFALPKMEQVLAVCTVLAATLLAAGATSNSSTEVFNPLDILVSPLLMVVDRGESGVATTLSRGLGVSEVPDPTASLMCKELSRDDVGVLVPPRMLDSLLEAPLTDTFLSATVTVPALTLVLAAAAKMPMLFFTNKNRLLIDPSVKQFNLRLLSDLEPWDLPVYAHPYPLESYEQPPFGSPLSAPPPTISALCVSPDRPRPHPVLFAPPK